ncbi:hypothetical protein THAOC_10256, partial [Thalassiosira oceanica]
MLAGPRTRPQSRRLGLLLAILAIVSACSAGIPNENDRFLGTRLDDQDRPLVDGENENEAGYASILAMKGQAPEVDADERLLRRRKANGKKKRKRQEKPTTSNKMEVAVEAGPRRKPKGPKPAAKKPVRKPNKATRPKRNKPQAKAATGPGRKPKGPKPAAKKPGRNPTKPKPASKPKKPSGRPGKPQKGKDKPKKDKPKQDKPEPKRAPSGKKKKKGKKGTNVKNNKKPKRVSDTPKNSQFVISGKVESRPGLRPASQPSSSGQNTRASASCVRANSRYRTCLDRDTGLVVTNGGKPQTRSGQQLASGFVYVNFLQDSTPTSCADVEQLEATTLSYLADNIGGTGANYGPVCVQARRDAYAEEQVPDRGRMTQSNTVEMEITYTVKNTRKLLTIGDGEFGTEVGDDNAERFLELQRADLNPASLKEEASRELNTQCSSLERALCCTQAVILGGDVGIYCRSVGCSTVNCGSGREPIERAPSPRQPSRPSGWPPASSPVSSPVSRPLYVITPVKPAGKPYGMPYSKPYYRPKPRYVAKTYTNTHSKPDKSWHKQARHNIFGRRTAEKAAGDAPDGNEDERQLQQSPRPFSLAGQDFNSVIRRNTAFLPAKTTAELDMLNLDDVATCAANRYSIEKQFGTPTLLCEDFERDNCEENDDLLPKLTSENGGCLLPMPTNMPTEMPTESPIPTYMPTYEPTDGPTGGPTETYPDHSKLIVARHTSLPMPPTTPIPSLSPTLPVPTQDPTSEPTTLPTAEPTLFPTGIPTQEPPVHGAYYRTFVCANQPTNCRASKFELHCLSLFKPVLILLGPTPQKTGYPTIEPTAEPTIQPTTDFPTIAPSFNP